MSTTFDFDIDDAYDPEPADPEQVARRLHRMRRRQGFETQRWEDLDVDDRDALVQMIVVLLAWLRRQGSRP
jgi:hypothetical protein